MNAMPVTLRRVVDLEMDHVTAGNSSGTKRSLSPRTTSFTKRVKLDLPQDQLTSLNKKIDGLSNQENWPAELERLTDPQKMNRLFWRILLHLSDELSTSHPDASFRTALSGPEARRLLKELKPDECEDWLAGLQKGVKSGDWLDVIAHPLILHTRSIEVSSTVARNATVASLQSAWNVEYKGHAHELLVESINQLELKGPYSNQIPIIQSSGTGKSRMVHEQASLVCTIPLNLRVKSADRDLAYPPADNAVRDHLISPKYATLRIVEGHYYPFFTSLFNTVKNRLSSLIQQRGKKWGNNRELARAWRSYLEDTSGTDDISNRTALYQTAIQEIEPVSEPNAPTRQNVASALMASSHALTTLIESIDGFVEHPSSDRIKLVMYVDETEPLTKVALRDSPYEEHLYDAFCHCMSTLNPGSFLCIFLSTAFNAETRAPSQPKSASARLHIDLSGIHAPFTETPFDCGPLLPVSAHQLTLTQCNKLKFMAQFGRPLFWSLLTSTTDDISDSVRLRTMRFARKKLLGDDDIDTSYRDVSKAAAVAVVDVGVMLSFEPRRPATSAMKADLIASHMRHVFSIPKHREYMSSGYPSEPIIAEAAAEQMWYWCRKDPNAFQAILKDNLDSGLLSHGELGETIGRQMLLSAYMRAVCKDDPSSNPPDFGRGCLFTSFVKEFFTSEIAEEILNSFPDNLTGGVPLKEALRYGRLRFTHFAKLADDAALCTNGMYCGFLRSMAFIGRNGQPDVDCLLPLLIWDDKLCEAVMTAILIQWKRRKRKGTNTQNAIDEETISFFPAQSSCGEYDHDKNAEGYVDPHNRPYVTWVIELDVQPPRAPGATVDTNVPEKTAQVWKTRKTKKGKGKEVVAAMSPTQPTATLAAPPPSVSDVYTPLNLEIQPHAKTTHPRYSVFAHGCSSSIFKDISKDTYALLLQTRGMFSEHSRQSPRNLAAVRRQKAVFDGGPDGYHWLKDDVLQTIEQDGIEIGSPPPSATSGDDTMKVDDTVGGCSSVN